MLWEAVKEIPVGYLKLWEEAVKVFFFHLRRWLNVNLVQLVSFSLSKGIDCK